MNLPESVIPAFLRAIRVNRPFLTAEGAAQEVRKQELRPGSYSPQKRLRPDVAVSVRRHGRRPVYTVTPSRSMPSGQVIYVHGGGWVHEINPYQWALIAQIAAEANTTVTVPIYELLPYGDAASTNEFIVSLFEDVKTETDDVRLAGDSAGGQIALSAALTLRDRGHADIRTVLISPPLDLTLSNPDIGRVLPKDPWLGVEGIRAVAKRWAGELPITDPKISPLLGDFDGLGPILLLTGTREILNPDAHLLVSKARAARVDVTLLERDAAVHAFPLLPTRPSAAARARIVAALRV
ncbi:alpha/beta hydrolase fold domain-containing protein [Leifsonia sp. Leaf336]|uniref:alpha/beta hydrolase fold domain-containing protein n=1 Tax=Leifsonia sp. Leaf336 TaxID=1736341 RepID=UPI001F1759E2|nr:alpha/beta hydrolase [Leifsonia sp. Leaf336]